FVGSTLIATVTSPPYTIVWSDVKTGDYMLTAMATDDLGATATSQPVHVSVQNPSADVAIVQNGNDPEIAKMEQYLFELGLTYHVFNREELTSQVIRNFSLIIWDDLGVTSEHLTEREVSIFHEAFVAEIPLYFIGENLASVSQQLTEPARSQWVGLTHL